jgi:hypothetical protein
VVALFPDMFCSFNLVKNHRNANNSTTTTARENISTDLESLQLKKIDVCLTHRFEKNN